jgi:hypothetical protein
MVAKNIKPFFITWVCVLLLNQIVIFGACFAPYCLIAALPHTGVIAAIITYFVAQGDKETEILERATQNTHTTHEERDEYEALDDFEETKSPFCPRCGSQMVLRKARTGVHAGNNFWGCGDYPRCKGILNV